MAFSKKLETLRGYGRKVVLPSDKIKRITTETILEKKKIDTVIDFGAGTLYWSLWLENYCKNVIAVDTFFEESIINNNIHLMTDITKAYPQMDDESLLVWISDVLHHLSEELWNTIKMDLYKRADYIVIKDIDCNHKFGNFMNSMHDFIINHERIRKIDPNILIQELKQQGFKIKFYSIPKLYYPHFLIIGENEHEIH